MPTQKKSPRPKPRTEIRKITPPSPTPKQEKQREKAQQKENARVRQAVSGMSYLGDKKPKGVTILSSKPLPLDPPTILSKNKK